MRFLPGCLLLVLLVSSLSPVHGVLEALNTNLKCQCTKTISSWNRPNMFSFIELYPAGNGCPNMEIMSHQYRVDFPNSLSPGRPHFFHCRVWLKTKSVLCLNPNAKWTKHLLRDILKKADSLNSPVRIRIRKA